MQDHTRLRHDLARIAATAPPRLAALALWLADNLPRVAFASVRGLAAEAGCSPNTVTRLAHALGYPGHEAFRAAVQAGLSPPGGLASLRAEALRDRPGTEIWTEALASLWQNIDQGFCPATLALLDSCVDPLLAARRVHAVGVRSCLSVAHYFSYVGGMAFANFAPVAAMPGAILDQMAGTGPEDIVVALTYRPYSAEVVRAVQIARETGARVLALTDSHAAPVALGAWKVLRLPMAGPQLMPTLAPAFVAVELLLAAMAARSAGAAGALARHEAAIYRFGGYLPDLMDRG